MFQLQSFNIWCPFQDVQYDFDRQYIMKCIHIQTEKQYALQHSIAIYCKTATVFMCQS